MQKLHRRILSAILALSMMFPLLPAVAANLTFDDVRSHWAWADIEEMAQLGFIRGMGANDFCPDLNIKCS